MGKEIEMKFVLPQLPDWDQFLSVALVDQTQYYWAIEPEREYRWRRSIKIKDGKIMLIDYSAATKDMESLIREENEQPNWPTKQDFEYFLMKGNFVGSPIEKTRRICVPKVGDWIFEIDWYHQPEEQFIAEVVFKTVEQLRSFVQPDWMEGALDVTDDPRYSASYVAEWGRFPNRDPLANRILPPTIPAPPEVVDAMLERRNRRGS